MLLVFAVFIACVVTKPEGSQKRAVVEKFQTANLSFPANLIQVPIYRQQTTYSCGPSSALSVLRYWDWKRYEHVTEQDLYGPMNCTEKDGTDPQPITAYLTNVAGLQATYVYGIWPNLALLEKLVDMGKPSIVDLQAWRDNDNTTWDTDWVDGHYNVLIGYDATNFFFMDPSTDDNYAYIPKKEFASRWHDLVGSENLHTYHMVILIEGSGNPHPITPVVPYATYED